MYQPSYYHNQYPQDRNGDIAVHIIPMKLEEEDEQETDWIEHLKKEKRDKQEAAERARQEAERARQEALKGSQTNEKSCASHSEAPS